MAKQISIDGFKLRIEQASLCRIKKPHSIYNEKIMVVIPFSIYNTRTTIRKFPNESYQYIIKRAPKKNGAKADYGFFDSLLNLQFKPNKESAGYIRIPFDGCGKYGIRFIYGRNNKYSITWTFNRIPNAQSIPTNLEFTNKARPVFNSQSKKIYHSNANSHRKNKTKKKKLKTDNSPYYSPDRLDMFDSYYKQESSRKAEFGHGRKRSQEWNDKVAKNFQKELKKQRGKNPDWTDRFALK